MEKAARPTIIGAADVFFAEVEDHVVPAEAPHLVERQRLFSQAANKPADSVQGAGLSPSLVRP